MAKKSRELKVNKDTINSAFYAALLTIKRYDPSINDFRAINPKPVMVEDEEGDYVRISEFKEDYDFPRYTPILEEYLHEQFTGGTKIDPDGLYYHRNDVKDYIFGMGLLRTFAHFAMNNPHCLLMDFPPDVKISKTNFDLLMDKHQTDDIQNRLSGLSLDSENYYSLAEIEPLLTW